MSPTARKEAFEKHKRGEVKILTGDKTFTEGYDDPEVEVCLNLKPSLSPVDVEQRGGRVLRQLPGKLAVVVDFVDENSKKPCVLFGDVIGGTAIPPDDSPEVATQRKKIETDMRELSVEGVIATTDEREIMRLGSTKETIPVPEGWLFHDEIVELFSDGVLSENFWRYLPPYLDYLRQSRVPPWGVVVDLVVRYYGRRLVYRAYQKPCTNPRNGKNEIAYSQEFVQKMRNDLDELCVKATEAPQDYRSREEICNDLNIGLSIFDACKPNVLRECTHKYEKDVTVEVRSVDLTCRTVYSKSFQEKMADKVYELTHPAKGFVSLDKLLTKHHVEQAEFMDWLLNYNHFGGSLWTASTALFARKSYLNETRTDFVQYISAYAAVKIEKMLSEYRKPIPDGWAISAKVANQHNIPKDYWEQACMDPLFCRAGIDGNYFMKDGESRPNFWVSPEVQAQLSELGSACVPLAERNNWHTLNEIIRKLDGVPSGLVSSAVADVEAINNLECRTYIPHCAQRYTDREKHYSSKFLLKVVDIIDKLPRAGQGWLTFAELRRELNVDSVLLQKTIETICERNTHVLRPPPNLKSYAPAQLQFYQEVPAVLPFRNNSASDYESYYNRPFLDLLRSTLQPVMQRRKETQEEILKASGFAPKPPAAQVTLPNNESAQAVRKYEFKYVIPADMAPIPNVKAKYQLKPHMEAQLPDIEGEELRVVPSNHPLFQDLKTAYSISTAHSIPVGSGDSFFVAVNALANAKSGDEITFYILNPRNHLCPFGS